MKTIIIVIAFAIFSAGYSGASEINVTFAYQDVSSFPYETGDGEKVDDEFPGISIDMIKKTAANLGITPKFTRLPWKRAFLMIETGELDAIISASFNENRASIAVYPMAEGKPDSSKRLYTSRYVFFQNRKTPIGWDGQKIATVTPEIHVPLGYSVANDIKNTGALVIEKADIKHSFMLLQNKRIGGLAELESSGMFYLKKNEKTLPDIEKVALPIKEKDYFVIFSKKFFAKNKSLVTDFWQKIADLRESPEMDAINNKYSEAAF